MQDILERAAQIDMVIFDVDGVLTDGRLFFGDDGEQYKAFHSRDGHGMKMLKQAGIPLAVITGRESRVVTHRMEELGIEHVYQGCKDKLPFFQSLCDQLDLDPARIAYMGDDVVDLPVMTRVGFAATVADAHPLAKRHAHWIAEHGGGQGAARDLCELILEARGLLDGLLKKYLE